MLCLELGKRRLPLISEIGEVSEEGTFFDIFGSQQLRERHDRLVRVMLCGGVWNVYLHRKAKKVDIRCPFCDGPNSDGDLFLGMSRLGQLARWERFKLIIKKTVKGIFFLQVL